MAHSKHVPNMKVQLISISVVLEMEDFYETDPIPR